VVDRYSRQVLFRGIGPLGQEKLRAARVAIIGCGALGSHSANALVRAGVGEIALVDRDFIEWDNLQRQILYDESDVRENLPKAIAAARKLKAVNSEVRVIPHVIDVHYSNVETLLRGVELVVDGTDNFETRLVLNDACLKLGKPWIYGGCVGSYGMVMPILPGSTPCLRCFMDELPQPGQTATCDTAGVILPAAYPHTE
jgi:adenylyltransferase/sulfurtransferase